jgi:2-polyprenyl-3-methyl-5-hydroxy-6-metoxy-1,4-benzoquinol methylase
LFGGRNIDNSTNLIIEKSVKEDILEKDSNGNNAPDARVLLSKRVNVNILYHPTFTRDDIEVQWSRLAPKYQYFERYQNLSTNVAQHVDFIKGWQTDIPAWRVICVLDFASWWRKESFMKSVLTISTTNVSVFPEMKFVLTKHVKNISEDDSGGVSLLQQIQDEHDLFDLVLAPSLLHSVYDPLLVLKEIKQKMKLGGYIFVGASTVQRMNIPSHFFHFMPMGLVAVLMSAGFQVKHVGQFGSWAHEIELLHDLDKNEIVSASLLRVKGGGFVSNDPARPDRVWALAQLVRGSEVFVDILADRSKGRNISHFLLNASQIQSLWNRIRPTPNYFYQHKHINKYFTENPATQWVRTWMNGKEFSRVVCLLDFHRWSLKYGFNNVKNLLITDDDPELHFIQAQKKITYKHTRDGGDLHYIEEAEVPSDCVDFVLFSQTLEHLYDPLLCLMNLRDKLKVNGMIFSSVPTLNTQHMTPHHFFHYTPFGLATIMERAGFEVLEVGQYGSWKFEQKVLGELSWPDHTNFIVGGELDIDPRRPDNVWVLARKKESLNC